MRRVDPVKHEEKRWEILAAAERCFARGGFHGATIAQICQEAAISPGHLYHYFASKEAIIAVIATAGLDYVEARFAEVREGDDPIEVLIAEYERLQALDRSGKPSVLLEVLAEAVRNPQIAQVLRETSAQMRRLMADFLRRGQARGQIDPDLDVEAASAVLLSLIDSNKTLALRAPDVDAQHSAAVMRTMIRRLLAAPGAAAS